jgi:hypothetical protein
MGSSVQNVIVSASNSAWVQKRQAKQMPLCSTDTKMDTVPDDIFFYPDVDYFAGRFGHNDPQDVAFQAPLLFEVKIVQLNYVTRKVPSVFPQQTTAPVCILGLKSKDSAFELRGQPSFSMYIGTVRRRIGRNSVVPGWWSQANFIHGTEGVVVKSGHRHFHVRFVHGLPGLL